MNNNDRIKFDYAQSNWRQSIAVKIASQIIWILVPTAFIASLFVFNELDKYIVQNHEYKVESLTYRVTNVILNSPTLTKTEKDSIIHSIASQLEFSDIKVVSSNYKLDPSTDTKQLDSTTRTVQLTLGDNFENEFVSVTGYHEPVATIISKTQKKVLGIIIIILTVLASLLVYSIRHKIYNPLNMLVNATEAASNGEEIIRLDTERKDEFGHLSVFFKKMLARLNEQHNMLKDSAEEARKANSAKSVFLANMSHELRTPLNAIIGYGELMIDDPDESISELHKRDLKKIVTSGQHLLHLINEILDLSKVEAGKLEVIPDHISLPDMLDEIAVTIQPLVKQNNNRLVIDCSPTISKIYSDDMKVRQVLINLLGNACKFTENGTISLKAEPSTIQSVDHVALSVSDTGAGISKDYIENLFKPFTQGDQSLNKSYGGTGLGLTICQKLSELLGGKITVDSTEGMGTTFTVTLPVKLSSLPLTATSF